jgi:hypothetical protein
MSMNRQQNHLFNLILGVALGGVALGAATIQDSKAGGCETPVSAGTPIATVKGSRGTTWGIDGSGNYYFQKVTVTS